MHYEVDIGLQICTGKLMRNVCRGVRGGVEKEEERKRMKKKRMMKMKRRGG